MLIQDMTREMSIYLLKTIQVGRIGCAQGSQPYVTPFSFSYHEDFIYSFATVGKKIEWMRNRGKTPGKHGTKVDQSRFYGR